RGPGRHRRSRCQLRAARAAQRDLCRDRHTTAPYAHRPQSARCGEESMSKLLRILSMLVVVGILVAAAAAWAIRGPSPTAFADGTTVALADYDGADPTGVPAALAQADPVTRGESLARAADCMACHTAPGGKQLAGGFGFQLPFGTLYSTNITP